MLGKILAFVLGVTGLVAGSQAPNFTNFFMENLNGRVAALEDAVGPIKSNWAQDGTSAEERPQYCKDNTSATGTLVDCLLNVVIVERAGTLMEIKEELDAASDWERPILLGRGLVASACYDVDKLDLEGMVDAAERLEATEAEVPVCLRDIAMAVSKDYLNDKMAVPTTTEGFAYAAGGGVGFWAIFRLLFALIGMPFRSRYAY